MGVWGMAYGFRRANGVGPLWLALAAFVAVAFQLFLRCSSDHVAHVSVISIVSAGYRDAPCRWRGTRTDREAKKGTTLTGFLVAIGAIGATVAASCQGNQNLVGGTGGTRTWGNVRARGVRIPRAMVEAQGPEPCRPFLH